MSRKNMNFGPSFIIFGDLWNLLWISKEFILYEYFPNGLIKFNWLWKPNSDFPIWIYGLRLNSFQYSVWTKLDRFKFKPKWIWLNPKEKWKILLFLRASLHPTATVANWANAQLVGPTQRPLGWSTLQCMPAAWCGAHRRVSGWRTTRSSAWPSSWVPLQAATQRTKRGGQNGVLTDEAVGVAAADGVEGGKGAPSSVLELQRSGANIRPCLIGSEKRENGGSPGAVNVICGICSGDRSSCLMMMNPRAKGAHKSEEYLLKRNWQRAEPIIG
jgi:hypothetical protein